MENFQPQQREPTSVQYTNVDKKAQVWHRVLGLVFLAAVLAAIIAGIYYWQTIKQIPSSFQFPNHKDETDEWKIYRDDEYGFQFKYPSEVFNEGAILEPGIKPPFGVTIPGKTFVSTSGIAIGVYVVNQDYKFILSMFKNYFADLVKEAKIAGVNASFVTIEDEGQGQVEYIMPLHDNTLVLTRSFIDENELISFKEREDFIPIEQQEKIFRQILSTFEFVDVGPSAGWKVYKDIQGRFEIKLPPGWTSKQIDLTHVGFLPPGKDSFENNYAGSITVLVLNNPRKLDLKTFYENRPFNLYEESAEAANLEINGFKAVKFSSVKGELISDTIAVNKGEKVIEITDPGRNYRVDGFLDLMADSIN